jgi:hypothetical protein
MEKKATLEQYLEIGAQMKSGSIDHAFAQAIIEHQIRAISDHLIDLSRAAADAQCSEGDIIVEHIGEGIWKFNPDEIGLHLADGQKNGKFMTGIELREALKNEPTMNANVCNYLYAHQELIPESWGGKRVYFWGTIIRHDNSDGLYDLYVPVLEQDDGEWVVAYGMINVDEWHDDDPAAVRKSA